MTEFTKEELEWLYDCVDDCVEAFQYEDIAYAVRDKLKTMLDNFPEPKKSTSCDKCGDKYHGNGAICV